ncbi:MAG: class I SAM-dependent methyltransferase [bacterium]|nr:class I SAM-dependent methyltransferase [bacterium]
MNISEVKKITETVHGWLTEKEGEFLYNCAKKCTGEGVIVEIGSWQGKSTIFLGAGSQAGNKVPVYAIDPHNGLPEEGGFKTSALFKDNIERAGLSSIVRPLVMTSETAAKTFNLPIELLFIDGDHALEMVTRDFELWAPKLVRGGMIALHDTCSSPEILAWPGPVALVKKSVYRSRFFKSIRIIDTITAALKTDTVHFFDRCRSMIMLARRALQSTIENIAYDSHIKKLPILRIFCFFLIAAAVRIGLEMYVSYVVAFPIQKYDSYIYVLKALEILRGDWSPIRTHAIGLPLFMAPFLYVWGAQSIFENLLVGILITAVTGAAAAFPIGWLTFKLTESKKALDAALIAFIFSFPLIISDNLFILTEPLFTLLFLTAICFVYKARDNPVFAYVASGIAGLTYWVRPNGIIVLPIVLISCWAWKKAPWRTLIAQSIAMTAIFFTVAAPMLLMRQAEFGSAFNYGENSKYFVERYVDVWGANPPVTLSHYLATHTGADILNRFITTGICLVLLYFAYSILPQLFFFLYGTLRIWRDPLWVPILTAMGIWVISLAPIFHLYYLLRHVFPIAPLGIIVAAAGLRATAPKNIRAERVFFRVFTISQIIILCVSLSTFIFVTRLFVKDISLINQGNLRVAEWASTHVKGVLATGNGINIMMLLPDARIGGRGLQDITAPQSGLSLTYPGKFDSIADAMPVLKERGVTHVLLEDLLFDPLPFVSNKYLLIYTGETIPPYLKEIYSNYETNSQAKVRIFKIDWDRYKQLNVKIL